MGLRDKFDEKIKRKEQEIQEYENKIREARAYMQALQDTVKLLPKEDNDASFKVKKIRPGSAVYKTMVFLKKAGKPVHINDILKGIGKTTSKKDRISLGGSLGLYIRKNEIFTRPEPNTFGLIAFEKSEEPPNDFGIDKI
jgi:predicted ribosome quality control (RQC) complex YloA/Tae2 family protein